MFHQKNRLIGGILWDAPPPTIAATHQHHCYFLVPGFTKYIANPPSRWSKKSSAQTISGPETCGPSGELHGAPSRSGSLWFACGMLLGFAILSKTPNQQDLFDECLCQSKCTRVQLYFSCFLQWYGLFKILFERLTVECFVVFGGLLLDCCFPFWII